MSDGEDEEAVVVDLGYRPREWQAEARARFKRFNVLIVHRRGGKTVLAIATLVDCALRGGKPNRRYAYIAPLRTQAKSVAWDYVKANVHGVPGVSINEAELSVTFPNGSRITLYGADNPDSLRGIYLDGVVTDEVADMKPATWEQVLRPALADREGWALFIGTVKGLNLLSQVYFAALQDDDWYAGLYTVDDTDALDPEEVEAAKRAMPYRLFAQEFLCDFGASNDNQLITLETVTAAIARAPKIESYSFAPKILGVDVARYGDDRSCIFRRQGLMSWAPIVLDDIDNMTLAGRVAEESEGWQADAIFIDAGRGEGVIDRLRQLNFSPMPVDFGGRPSKPIYANKRAEMWHAMAKWLDEGAIVDLPVLKADLCTPEYSYANARNVMELESKDRIRKRGLRSPDLGDALALTFAQPVAIKRPEDLVLGHSRRTRFAEMDNPWSEG